MKKLFTLFAAFALVAVAANVQAQESYVAGGFEASGHVVTGFGYQQHSTNVPLGDPLTNADWSTTRTGVTGKYIGGSTTLRSKEKRFDFFLDEVELDLMKSFGENVRLRADLEFGRGGSGSPQGAANLEQAYATANIPVGNGLEFLVGRFNAPIGFESVDVVDNDTISFSRFVLAGLRPTNLTGAKIYYPFSDRFDLHLYASQRWTGDGWPAGASTATRFPNWGFRFGVNWGEEGQESTVGFSGFAGPESGNRTLKRWSFGGDVDFNWWVTEAFALGGEGIFRSDREQTTASANLDVFGGLLNVHYLFSDVWDGTLRYTFAKQGDATNLATTTTGTTGLTGLGGKGWGHQLSLAGGYMIADGAKLMLEGRFDMQKQHPTATTSNKAYVYGAALAFAYNF